jgi:hypothetical protein
MHYTGDYRHRGALSVEMGGDNPGEINKRQETETETERERERKRKGTTSKQREQTSKEKERERQGTNGHSFRAPAK